MPTDFSLAPIADADWPEQIADMRQGFAGGLNVYRTMAHHPALMKAWANLREHIVNGTALGKQRSEVVVLRTGFRLRSEYEWSQHVVRARSRGLDDVRISSLRGQVADMQADDAILAQAVDELFAEAKLSSQTAGELADHVGVEGVIDLIATVGFYSTLGFILNTARTPLDSDIAAEIAATPLTD